MVKLNKKAKNAFTLAETLTTLAIIGIVAAMTLPVILNKSQDRINRNKLKREYSILQQAFQKISAENDVEFKNALVECANSTNKHACLKDIFKAKLNTVIDCDKNNGENLSKCFVPQSKVKYLNGKSATSSYSGEYFNGNTTSGLVLNDGASASFWLDTAECNNSKHSSKQRCGFIVIDVNGPNLGPNTWGKNLYLFFVLQNRIVPADAKSTDGSCSEDDDEVTCYQDDCEAGTNYGMTCAGKYLYE